MAKSNTVYKKQYIKRFANKIGKNMELIIDKLIKQIKAKQNPSTIGLDTDFEYLDQATKSQCKNNEDKCSAIFDYNMQIIDSLCDIVPSVKVQIAYYEIYGTLGLEVFAKTVQYAKSKGLITIVDAKRGDIGASSKMYAQAFLKPNAPYECDFLTVNGYFGTDGLLPFVSACQEYNKGLFVLVKTSNPSSKEIQNIVQNGKTVYQHMADMCVEIGKDMVGQFGYSNIGAVVGCTHPTEVKQMRNQYTSLFMLVPGYGAQGGSADNAKLCFDSNGNGAIVNSSRGILCAYQSPKYKGQDCITAAKNAAIDMKKDLS